MNQSIQKNPFYIYLLNKGGQSWKKKKKKKVDILSASDFLKITSALASDLFYHNNHLKQYRHIFLYISKYTLDGKTLKKIEKG